eukprot:NODE_150_length_17275_cov_0.559618.p13 type:complete len:134 gc:universal NODE_150_length_17275_cov_0.559618:2060-1659(-)
MKNDIAPYATKIKNTYSFKIPVRGINPNETRKVEIQFTGFATLFAYSTDMPSNNSPIRIKGMTHNPTENPVTIDIKNTSASAGMLQIRLNIKPNCEADVQTMLIIKSFLRPTRSINKEDISVDRMLYTEMISE